jgi:hypothetical protein
MSQKKGRTSARSDNKSVSTKKVGRRSLLVVTGLGLAGAAAIAASNTQALAKSVDLIQERQSSEVKLTQQLKDNPHMVKVAARMLRSPAKPRNRPRPRGKRR